MKRLFIAFFGLFFYAIIAQPCDFENQSDQIALLIKEGSFSEAIKSCEMLQKCESLSASEKISIFISQHKAYRNSYKFNKAQEALFEAKNIIVKNNLDVSFEFRFLLAENYGHRPNPDEYQNLMTILKDSLFNGSNATEEHLGRFYLSSYRTTNKNAELSLAINHLLAALQAFEKLDDPPVYYLGNTLRGLGNMYRNAGDYDKSIFYYKKGKTFISEHYPKDHYEVAYYNYTIAAVYYEKMEYQSALDYFLLAHKVWVHQLEPQSKYMRYLNEGIGDMYWELDDPKNALRYFNYSIEGEKDVNNDISESTLKTADSLIEKGKYADAIKYYEKAYNWRIKEFGKESVQTAACKNFVARAIRFSGDTEGALTAYQDAIRILVTDLNDSSWYANPTAAMDIRSHQYLQESLIAKGELLKELYTKTQKLTDLQAALDTQETAIGFLEDIKNSQLSEESREFWTQRTLGLVESAIATAVQLFDTTKDNVYLNKAFNFSERSKALLLLSTLYDQEISSFANVSEEIITTENDLKRSMNEYVGKIEAEEKRCADIRSKILSLWRTELNSLQSEYDLLVARIKTEYPDYYQLKFDSQIVKLQDIQNKILNKNRAMVSYFTGAQNTYIFFITHDNISIRILENTIELNELVDGYFTNMSSQKRTQNAPQKSFNDFTNDGFVLYSKLLQPELDKKEFESLIIIPDGKLCYLPFESLLTHRVESQSRNYKALPYLLKECSVSYSPSASIKWLTEAETPTSDNYIGFAPNYEGQYYKNVTRSDNTLANLRYNSQEVNLASKLFNGKGWTGNQVTEDLLKSESENVGILHLAMHGAIENEHPLLSKLYFNSSSKEDGMLHIYEIYNMNIPAQLVILSACNTASGKLVRGEGILSLERAFQYAGSKALLSTLWTVDDAATLHLNEYFLKNLKSGSAKDVALRDAKLQFLATAAPENLHPFYWSSFKLTGNTKPLIKNYKSHYIILGLGIVGLFFGIVFIKRRNKKRLD